MKKNSRIKNATYNSATGMAYQLLNSVLALVYRTAVIKVLGVEYLGINGLFSNVLMLLSLTELGINVAITFRMYEPAQNEDYVRLSALISFFERIYKIIALIVLIIGLCLMPFLKFLIKDLNEVSSDVNIYLVYIVMLVQSSTSYLFTCRQTLLQAWQQDYINNVFRIIYSILLYAVQIGCMIIYRDYTLVLIVATLFGVIMNWVYYVVIEYQYKEVFAETTDLAKEEKNEIFHETKALLFHKVGGAVLQSTDSLVISKFLGLGVVGIYSNYTVITQTIAALVAKFFNGTVAGVGNVNVTESSDKLHNIYMDLSLMVMWAASYCSVCLFVCFNPFITIWVGKKLCLSVLDVFTIAFSFYVVNSRFINTIYVNACGLYYLDQFRPLLEAGINIVLSVILARYYGVAGVCIGTIVSEGVTAWWREPYLLYKKLFDRSAAKYWRLTAFMMASTVVMQLGLNYVCSYLPENWLGLILRVVCCTVLVNLFYYLFFRNTDSYKYIKSRVRSILKR